MNKQSKNRQDWSINIVLLTIWVVAVSLVAINRKDIPVSMLVIASVFFVLLIPAMKELVKTMERLFGPKTTETDSREL